MASAAIHRWRRRAHPRGRRWRPRATGRQYGAWPPLLLPLLLLLSLLMPRRMLLRMRMRLRLVPHSLPPLPLRVLRLPLLLLLRVLPLLHPVLLLLRSLHPVVRSPLLLLQEQHFLLRQMLPALLLLARHRPPVCVMSSWSIMRIVIVVT